MKIDRKKSIEQLIKKLGYKEYIDENILKTLKNKGPKEGEIEFFTLGKYVSNTELLKEYETRGLTPDLGATITYLIENPQVLDEKKYIGIQLEDNSFAAFFRWDDGRYVYVRRIGHVWFDFWWFIGVKKQPFNTPH
jgi:hypothetical protein